MFRNKGAEMKEISDKNYFWPKEMKGEKIEQRDKNKYILT